jgi:hypothetical protein
MKERQGLIDKGLEKWQKFNKITLVGGVAAGAVGVLMGMPWLVTLGLGSAAIDAGQILALEEVKRKRNRKNSQLA